MGLAVHDGPTIARRRLRTLFREFAAATGLVSEKVLPVSYSEQEQGNWCWAACCQMLLGLLNKPAQSQCRIVERQFHGSCCQNPTSPTCDRGEWPEAAYPAHAISLERIDRALGDGELRAEIDAGRAVEVYYVWQGGLSAHVALITGYYSNGDFEVFDPARTFGRGRRAYDRIVAAYGLGQWRLSYAKIRG